MRGKILLILLLTLASQAFCQHGDGDVGDPGAPPRVLIGRYLKEGHWRRAEGLIRQEMVRDSSDYYKKLLCWTMIEQAGQLIEKNKENATAQFKEAEHMLHDIMLRDSNDEGVYWYLAMSASKQDQGERALGLYKRYIQKARYRASKLPGTEVENPKAWLHMGAVFRRKMHDKGINDQEWIEMVYDFEVYLRMNPDDPYAFNLQDFLDHVRLKRPEPNGVLVWDEKNR